MKTTLNNYASVWFKSLDIVKMAVIADHYTIDTGDNTNIAEGLNEGAVSWLVQEYSDDIKDYIITSPVVAAAHDLLEALKIAHKELMQFISTFEDGLLVNDKSIDIIESAIKKATE